MNKLSIKAPAKLNLHLQVLGKRGDGYHDISSYFSFINLFDVLEFKTLKDRMKPVLNKAAQSSVSSPEFTLFAEEIHEGVITADAASKRIAGHSGEIAIAFSLLEEKLHSYAVALSQEDIFLVHESTMGDWAINPQVKKLAHDAKSLSRINAMSGVEFDTSIGRIVS